MTWQNTAIVAIHGFRMRNIELENILKCPITQHDMSLLTHDELAELNLRIERKEISTAEGVFHYGPIEAAYRVKESDLYYPIIQGIIYLLPDLALRGNVHLSNQYDAAGSTKQSVRNFYDKFGWLENEGIFQDAKDSEDLRQVSQDYILNCHLRLNQYLPKRGKYILDIASGPIQYEAYLSYSQHFEYRICADISLKALVAAKQKLGDRGIYILCDVTQLPLKTQSMDAIVSLHTLYHVPREQQAQAFAELYRALKTDGVSVIVYSWGRHSLLMNLFLLPMKVLSLVKRKLAKAEGGPSLYFYAHNYRWYLQEIKAKYQTQLYPWRSVNVPFLKLFIHRLLGGKQLLKLIYTLENLFPTLMGKWGAYPLFVCRKK